MAIEQRRPTSIYLTFKVIQLVQRLKSRVSGFSTKRSILGSKTCLGLESKAVRAIEKGLSRASPQGRKHLYHASNRVSKSRKGTRPSLKLHTSGQHRAVNPNTSGEHLQHALQSLDLDGNISPHHALSAVCLDDKLFLRNDRPNFDACSLNETVQSLVLVHEAINVLYAARSQYDDNFIVAQGHEVGLDIDARFIANYEHLLLRLQTQLVETLSRKVVEALIENDLDKTQRKLLNWFTEFPDNQHPLNTTFPWAIKPSLAVLWGVCWMFYYNHSDHHSPREQNAGHDNHRIPQDRFLRDEGLRGWNAPQPNEYFNFGLELTGAQLQPATQQHAGADASSIGGGGRHWPLPLNLSTQATSRPNTSRVAQPHWFAPVLPGLGTGGPGPTPTQRTYYPQAIRPVRPTNINNLSLPANSGIATTQVFAFQQQQLDVDSLDGSWQLPYTQHLQNLPQRASGHLTVPAVQISSDDASDSSGFAQPQSHLASFDIYGSGAQQPQLNVHTNLSHLYNMGNTPLPEASSIHSLQDIRHERNSSVHSTSNMPTPVSIDNRSPLLSPVGGGRRLSNASSSSHGLLPPPSDDGSSQDGDDLLSPRGNRAYKRAEEPPRNQDNKMICKHKDCATMIFDRKCEWSKHMDKHDRPYKCTVKGCEKLQGFTYSGGLLRHEREVHKMHGGTKKSLFCPFADCKRSSGSGFTRKENLAEHIRRVHRRTSTSSDLGHMIIQRPDSQDGATDVHLPESPYQRSAVDPQDEAHFALKRKRGISDAGMSDVGDESDLRAEVKCLRRQNEEKDSRLRQLEAAVAMLQQSSRR